MGLLDHLRCAISLFDRYYWTFAILYLVADLFLNVLIVRFIDYTEIDWIAYMQEVEGFLSGDWNYPNLRGHTGPLVYPAGFLYLYTVLRWATDSGKNILRGQILFIFVYLAVQAVIFAIYSHYCRNESRRGKRRGKRGRQVRIIPTLLLFSALCVSKRIHSIFVLRLFNDCFAMLFCYLSILCILSDSWSLALCIFSIGVSIKMNIILFLPGLLVLLVQRFGAIRGVLGRVWIIVAVQVVLGIPFLVENWRGYLGKSFELDRKFFHIWTVNFKFLPEEIFLSDVLDRILLVGTAGSMLAFGWFKWARFDSLWELIFGKAKGDRKLRAEHVINVLFTCNFLGIVFSRTLHFQFYVWYFHCLPLVVWSVPYIPLKIAALLAIEIVFNVFPSNFYSSLTLTIVHLIVFICSIFSKNTYPYRTEPKKKQEEKKPSRRRRKR